MNCSGFLGRGYFVRRLTLAFVAFVFLACGAGLYADSYSIFGGLKRELTLKKGVYYYEELSFMSGKPVVLKGTVTVPNVPNSKEYKLSVKYELQNKVEEMNISRTVSYAVKESTSNEMGQKITNWTIPEGGLKETVKIKDKTYELSSFQFDNSSIRDKKPAIDFISSNIYYKKVFHTDGALSDTGSRIVIIGESKTDLAYENYWSKLNSRIIGVSVEYDDLPKPTIAGSVGPDTPATPQSAGLSWKGTAQYKFSTNTQSSFENVVNDVQSISFKKGLLKSENTEDVLSYSYDMPAFGTAKETEEKEENREEQVKRNKGEGMLSAYVYEKSTRLPVPKFKDIGGHWAEKDIFKLASIEAFEMDEVFFPDVFVTRAQFARAMVNSVSHVDTESVEQRKAELIKSKRKGADPLPFEDVPRDDRYFVFIDKANSEGIMVGEGNEQFLPARPLTRAEAITVMMRSIGVVDIAPAMPFDTGFVDDKDIPVWAKPSIYMAREIGVVKGYEDGTSQPLSHVTRAEASAMLSRLIEHLRRDITLDYRERLLESRN